jgi:lycopene cyclase domain-containing protein
VAILIPAAIFIVWDELFTQLGVWGFNPKYLTGVYTGSLPVEEVLFFICIPYACVFTYEALNYLVKRDYFKSSEKSITVFLVIILLITGFTNLDKWYTSVTCIAMAVFLSALQFIFKTKFLSRFYFAYLFILIPFFMVNGILTGTGLDEPVVWYNNAENLGIRMGTIPIEDTFYGMLLLLMNVSIFEWLQKKKIA